MTIDSFFINKYVESTDGNSRVLERELAPLKKINDNYPKYILILDDDLDADFDGIKKINVVDYIAIKFKGIEFETFENEAGKHSFYMSP